MYISQKSATFFLKKKKKKKIIVLLSRSDRDRIFAKLRQIWRKYSVVIVIVSLCDREKKIQPGYFRVVLCGKS